MLRRATDDPPPTARLKAFVTLITLLAFMAAEPLGRLSGKRVAHDAGFTSSAGG
ncbi:MAG: hypothetical protein Q4D19_04225 [Lautropia sp.]|nr:hypothetical protein [Lautropia sp.]